MTGDVPQDLPPELDAPRARFIAELGERISVLRQSLARFGGAAEPAGELNALRRRVHALAAGADVLRFSRAAEALASAETGLAAAGGWDPGTLVRERVARILDLLPSLVLGAPLDLAAELDNPRLEPLREPLCVVVYADASLESLLHKPGSPHAIESHATRAPEHAIELVAQLSPDIVLVDADDPDVSEMLPRLRQASGARQAVVVAVGSFDRPEPLARLMRRGVSRVLPKPTDAGTLQRTLRQVTLSESSALPRSVNYRRLSGDELVEAIASEARKAFRDPLAAHSVASLDLGSNAEVQAALWGAFARLRALAARNTEGIVSFLREGPGGATLLAPEAPAAAAASSRPAVAPVPLAGRRLIVADDDPAIRTLLSNAFAELGATVLPARDGAEALDLAERHWPDALVSDTLMPQLDGFELCRRLRQDIALSDLPVLLVAWKEHLLECARSATGGPALEQLDGPSLTLALRDCLAPRAALEQRLAQHDAVHGRLDGLTPRLLLQMVCNRSPNALLSLRSGTLTFEFSIGDGKPVHARWYDGEQLRGEGKAVLAPFLGVRTGRFSVEPLFSPPPAHFEGDVMAVLNPAAIRARRAREHVSPRNLTQVEQVLLDPLATEHYLAEFPTSSALVSELSSPDALRRLVAEDAAGSDPGRLHALLADLARHGAIGALLDREGRDLLPGGPAFRPASSPPKSARAKSSRPAPAPAPALPPAPEAGEAGLNAVSEAQLSAAPGVPSLVPGGPPPEPAAAPAPSAEPEAGEETFFAPQGPPGAAAIAGAAASPPAPSEAGPEPPAAAADTGARRASELAEAAPPAPDERALPDSRAATVLDSEEPPSEELDSAWPPSPGARLRAALGRATLSLGAALLAFLAIRALAFRSWDSRGAPLPGAAAVTPQLAAPVLASSVDAGARAADRGPSAAPLVFDSEPLDLPADAKLPPGQGLLEVRSSQRRQMFVDGVLMGNDENRLIPLGPGTYQLRLSDGASDLERSVEVKAGRRTRVSARPKSSP